MVLNAYEIIAKKRDGHELTEDEVKWFISGLVNGTIQNYQMTALLMAIYLNGFTVKETAALTDAMLYSGKTINFETQDVVDKHSTGGIGDKASFILAPIASACGVKVPMIAGRGLGHTGGTIDKVEAIKGFKTTLSLKEFKENVLDHGLSLIGQTKDIAPADKIIYGLRDVTATVESIPLITASIMSKKLAEGAAGIVMDIKVGNGAFMSSKAKARALAKSIRQTGLRFNKNMVTMITDMNQPLGNTVGNSIEIIESIETLKNKGPKDLTTLSLHLAGAMVFAAGKSKTLNAGIKQAKQALESGAALEEFRKLIKRQGGDEKVIDDYSRLPQAKNELIVKAPKKGFIKKFNTKAFGQHVVSLGGGRKTASDKIDFAVGLTFHKKLNDSVKEGDALVTIHYHDSQQKIADSIAFSIVKNDITLSGTKSKNKPELIYETEVSWSKK
jgi:pyrimidine-nucleoside phosphorylase